MLIDWFTLSLPRTLPVKQDDGSYKMEQLINDDLMRLLEARCGWMLTINKVNPDLMPQKHVGPVKPLPGIKIVDNDTGELLYADAELQVGWQRLKRESIRSDTHSIVIDPSPHFLTLHGSPARVSYTSNVFGKSDPKDCALDMIEFAEKALNDFAQKHRLPLVRLCRDLNKWKCTRMDVTQNYDLGSDKNVQTALQHLSLSSGGRFQVQKREDTVYWSKNSDVRTLLAYAKGPNLRALLKKHEAYVTDDQLLAAFRLLRLELRLKNHFWRENAEKAWHEYTADDLTAMHIKYFSQVIGKIEVKEMGCQLEQFYEAAEALGLTKGRADAAYACWCQIQKDGYLSVEMSVKENTLRMHRRIMFAAGLSWADLKSGTVVPFRMRTIELGDPVADWEDLFRRKVA